MQNLLDYLEARQEEMVEVLRELVRQESPSNDKPLLDQLAADLARRLGAVGAEVTLIENPNGGNHVRAALLPADARAAGQRPALILCHYDTVWAKGSLASNPFKVEDGCASGPGAFDMKAGVVLMLFAVQALRDLQLQVPRPIVTLLTSDEEIGSLTSRALIEAEAERAAYVLVLESPLPDGSLKTARKGIGFYRIDVQGRAAHAGLEPEKGISAVHELTLLTQRLHQMSDPDLGTTLNVGVVRGGTRANVVPAHAQAELDVRVSTMAEAERIEQAIRALQPILPGARYTVEGGLNRPPLERTRAVADLFEQARAIGRDLGLELTEGSAGGGSDGNFTAALGLPTLDGLGAPGDGAHADHEYVRVDSMPSRAALLAALVLRL